MALYSCACYCNREAPALSCAAWRVPRLLCVCSALRPHLQRLTAAPGRPLACLAACAAAGSASMSPGETKGVDEVRLALLKGLVTGPGSPFLCCTHRGCPLLRLPELRRLNGLRPLVLPGARERRRQAVSGGGQGHRVAPRRNQTGTSPRAQGAQQTRRRQQQEHKPKDSCACGVGTHSACARSLVSLKCALRASRRATGSSMLCLMRCPTNSSRKDMLSHPLRAGYGLRELANTLPG